MNNCVEEEVEGRVADGDEVIEEARWATPKGDDDAGAKACAVLTSASTSNARIDCKEVLMVMLKRKVVPVLIR